jgi:hypothetical protein
MFMPANVKCAHHWRTVENPSGRLGTIRASSVATPNRLREIDLMALLTVDRNLCAPPLV